LQKRKVLSLEWKSEVVMDDESGELVELMEEVPLMKSGEISAWLTKGSRKLVPETGRNDLLSDTDRRTDGRTRQRFSTCRSYCIRGPPNKPLEQPHEQAGSEIRFSLLQSYDALAQCCLWATSNVKKISCFSRHHYQRVNIQQLGAVIRWRVRLHLYRPRQ